MRRRYAHDDHYFDRCDTDQKAYWIGFLLAEGSVRNNTLRVRLAVEAAETLARLKRDLRTDAPVRKEADGTYAIDVSSPALCRGLAQFGIVPRKTFKVSWPSRIPRAHEKAFLLGLFDGDGTITRKTTHYRNKVYVTPCFGICGGSDGFLKSVVGKLSEHAGVDRNKVIRRQINGVPTRTYVFTYQGAPALRIRDAIYSCDAECFGGKKAKFFSYEYPSSRPHDRRDQQLRWENRIQQLGGKLLGVYVRDSVPFEVECKCGHVWSPRPVSLYQGSWCPRCATQETADKQRTRAYNDMKVIFRGKGWTLLTTKSQYSTREGQVRFLCEHNVEHTRHCRSAIKDHATCDCKTTNSSQHGKRVLEKRLAVLGWKLVSEYRSCGGRVKVTCHHGRTFWRIANNIRPESRAVRCDCEKQSSSGEKFIYSTKAGYVVSVSVAGKSVRVGSSSTLSAAKKMRNAFLRANRSLHRLK